METLFSSFALQLAFIFGKKFCIFRCVIEVAHKDFTVGLYCLFIPKIGLRTQGEVCLDFLSEYPGFHLSQFLFLCAYTFFSVAVILILA